MSSNPHAERGTRFWSPRTWSLRVRLLVTQVVLLAVVCAALGVATEFALQRFLMRQLDTQLVEAGHRSAAILELPPPMLPMPPIPPRDPAMGPMPPLNPPPPWLRSAVVAPSPLLTSEEPAPM